MKSSYRRSISLAFSAAQFRVLGNVLSTCPIHLKSGAYVSPKKHFLGVPLQDVISKQFSIIIVLKYIILIKNVSSCFFGASNFTVQISPTLKMHPTAVLLIYNLFN